MNCKGNSKGQAHTDKGRWMGQHVFTKQLVSCRALSSLFGTNPIPLPSLKLDGDGRGDFSVKSAAWLTG